MPRLENIPPFSASDENQMSERSLVYDDLFGLTIGSFTPTTAESSGYPADVQRALVGVAMPVRKRLKYALDRGSVLVSADEYIDVLTTAGVSKKVLKYLLAGSIDDDLATISYARDEGDLVLF